MRLEEANLSRKSQMRIESPQEKGTDDSDMKFLMNAQRILALAAFAKAKKLNIDPIDFLDKTDPEKGPVRDDAGMMWASHPTEGEPSLAKRFKAYYAENAEAVKSINLNDPEKRAELLDAIEQFPVEAGGGVEVAPQSVH